MVYNISTLILILCVCLFPSNVLALPTPDTIIGLVNIIPILTGAIAALAGGIYLTLGRVFGVLGSKIVLGVLGVLVILLLFGGYSYQEKRRIERVNQIAVYLLCSPSAHEFHTKWMMNKLKPNEALKAWSKYGNFVPIDMDDIPQRLAKQPNALLLGAKYDEFRYYSGFPAVQIAGGGGAIPFKYIRSSELSKFLKDKTAKDLYLYHVEYFDHSPDEFIWDKSVFTKFDNIYLVHKVKEHHLYVFDKQGSLVKAKKESVIDWPIRRPWGVINEKVVNFPNASHLIPDNKMVSYLHKNDVFLVTPYANYRRSDFVHYLVYLNRLLSGIDKSRVLSVCMDKENTTEVIDEMARVVDGHRFVIIGWDKYDWMYEGLGLAHELWRKLDRDPKRFRLLGFNARFTDVVAISWEKQKNRGVLESLRKPFWQSIERVQEQTKIKYGLLIFLFAMVLRLTLFPLGFLEAYSRIKREYIQKACRNDKPPAWASAAKHLLRGVEVRSHWELLGGLVTLLLILPAYSILSHPTRSIPVMDFLWIDDLLRPDIYASIVIGILLYCKLQIEPSSGKRWWKVLVVLLFTFIFARIPAILMVYLGGVLVITLIQDSLALFQAKKIIKRALLQ